MKRTAISVVLVCTVVFFLGLATAQAPKAGVFLWAGLPGGLISGAM